MKRFGLYIIILLGSLLTVGCCKDDDELPPPEPTIQPRAEMERTVIVYMAGDNSLGDASSYNAIPKDTAEMVLGKAMIPEDVNFIIFVDDRQHKPAIYELSQKGGMQLWKQYKEELCTSDSQTMLNVLREIEQYFPARHYGITFWSHASGWAPTRMSTRLKTFGQDLDRGTTDGPLEMEIPVLRSVLAQLPKFDYIFFDACFMQCIEVAYELKDVTDYMVGSPAEIPGPGAPYNKIIEPLCKGDAKGIVMGYSSGYPSGIYSGVLLSCIDCSKLDDLAQATGQLLTQLYMGRKDLGTYGFQVYCDSYSRDRKSKYPYYFDMRTTMNRLLSYDEEAYVKWMEHYNQAVPLRIHSTPSYDGQVRWYANFCTQSVILDPECYGGVSMFVPLTIYEGYGWNEDFQKTSWYKAAGWEATGW